MNAADDVVGDGNDDDPGRVVVVLESRVVVRVEHSVTVHHRYNPPAEW